MINREIYLRKLRKRLFDVYNAKDYLQCALISERILKYSEENNLEKTKLYRHDLYNIGTIYIKMGKPKKAIEVLQKAAALTKKVEGESLTYSNILNNLAIAYNKDNKLSKASITFKEALQIKRNLMGENNDDYINTLCNFGCACYDMRAYDDAIKYLFEALDKREEQTLDTVDNYNFLGYAFEAKKDYDNAVLYFEKAIRLIKRVEGEDSQEYFSNAYYIAGVYNNYKKYDKALKYYEISVEKIKLLTNESHPYYAEALNKLSNVCFSMGSESRALMLRIKALNIVKDSVGEDHIYYASSLKNVADLYFHNKDYKRAIPMYEKEIEIKINIMGRESEEVIKSELNILDTYILAEEYENAGKIAKNIIESVKVTDSYYLKCLKYLSKIPKDSYDANWDEEISNIIRTLSSEENLEEIGEKNEIEDEINSEPLDKEEEENSL